MANEVLSFKYVRHSGALGVRGSFRCVDALQKGDEEVEVWTQPQIHRS